MSMPMPTASMTPALLIRWSLPDAPRQQALEWGLHARALTARLLDEHRDVFSSADVVLAQDGSRLHACLWAREAAQLSPELRDEADRAARVAMPGVPAGEAVRLAPLQDAPGASATTSAPTHYVVELDIDPEHRLWMQDWYQQEHLPALAACPGTVRARRFENLDGGPASLACYDLTSADILTSDAWLAVRATDWSSQIRPLFRNVRRTVFDRLHSLSPTSSSTLVTP
jgi:hypothetical protein